MNHIQAVGVVQNVRDPDDERVMIDVVGILVVPYCQAEDLHFIFDCYHLLDSLGIPCYWQSARPVRDDYATRAVGLAMQNGRGLEAAQKIAQFLRAPVFGVPMLSQGWEVMLHE